ncbi:MAG: SOS response-associated peptidase [Candidatus Kapabacteria bacterium]|nr:SOS response-associated peptidase [Candidatus Kapabacteria bacterium]
MCGRYTFFTPPRIIEKRFHAKVTDTLIPRYNAAPTQLLPVIRDIDGKPRSVELLSWGLVPSWSTDIRIASKLINARAETLADKPSFRNALKSRRCLVLADGFYEWKSNVKPKVPVRITCRDESPFAMAGIWERWVNPVSGEILESFAIITVPANETLLPYHERMPAFLQPEHEDIWLDAGVHTQEHLKLLATYPADKVSIHVVSARVNDNKHDDAELLTPDSGTTMNITSPLSRYNEPSLFDEEIG